MSRLMRTGDYPLPCVVIHNDRREGRPAVPVAVQIDEAIIEPTEVVVRASTGETLYEVTVTFLAHSVETAEVPE